MKNKIKNNSKESTLSDGGEEESFICQEYISLFCYPMSMCEFLVQVLNWNSDKESFIICAESEKPTA